jgi:hypothetical protein
VHIYVFLSVRKTVCEKYIIFINKKYLCIFEKVKKKQISMNVKGRNVKTIEIIVLHMKIMKENGRNVEMWKISATQRVINFPGENDLLNGPSQFFFLYPTAVLSKKFTTFLHSM